MQNIFTATLFAIVMGLVAGLPFLMAISEGDLFLWLTGGAIAILGMFPLAYFIWWRSTGYRG